MTERQVSAMLVRMPFLAPPLSQETPRPLILSEIVRAPNRDVRLAFETTRGVAWLTFESVILGKLTQPLPPIASAEGTGSHPSASHGFLTYRGKQAQWVWNPATGRVQRFHFMWPGYGTSCVDAKGNPVGFLNLPGQQNPAAHPMRGRIPLRTPPAAVGNSRDRLFTSPKGMWIAGTLSFGDRSNPHRRACLWSQDRKSPKLLPLLRGFSEASASGVNSVGDVIGLMIGERIEPQAVVWRGNGRIERLPLTFPDRAEAHEGSNDAYWWRAREPQLITDDGLIIGSEGTVAGGMILRTLVLGDRATWLPQAIEGLPDGPLGAITTGVDGRGIVIAGYGSTDLMRVRRRAPVSGRSTH